MDNGLSGRWIWKKRVNETGSDWYEEKRKRSLLSLDAVKKRMSDCGCRHVAGKGRDTTYVFECPESD